MTENSILSAKNSIEPDEFFQLDLQFALKSLIES